MRTAPLITPPPSKGTASAPAAPSLPPAPLAMPVPTMPMDREFIVRNQIAERYISGRLPLRGAQEFERYCLQHPDLIDELGLPERVHAGLRLLAASRNVVLAAEGYGKHKTISQITAILAVLVLMSYEEWGPIGKAIFGFPLFGKPWVAWFTPLAIWVSVILTFTSGALYLWRNRNLYLQDM